MVKQFNKAKISITVDQDVFDIVEKLAEKDDRSVSSMINKILKEWVEKRDQK